MMQAKIFQYGSLAFLLIASMIVAASPAPAASSPSGAETLAEMEAFFDGLMVARMNADHLPGAVVMVVKNGQVLFIKGYGYADLEQRIPVDPERALFRLGSVSKLFVWTAVMQLVEQGRLALDSDVNAYLDFAIPATFDAPMTLKHVLAHTAGFEERVDGVFTLSAAATGSLAEYVKNYLPARVFPPGTIGAYSNYGTALAGYIVQRVSGLPFDEYVEQHILLPLGMTRSTFRQPLPDALAVDLARGYNFVEGEYLTGDFEFVQAYPAGSLSACAPDIAKFMIAHLQNGAYGNTRILQESTARQMHSDLFAHDSRIDGMAYGFFKTIINGQRIISHGGDTFLFHTGVFLIPEQNLGVFVSTNGAGGGSNADAVLTAFIDRYYPVEDVPAPTPAADFSQRIAPYLGEYTAARSNFSTFESVLPLLSPTRVSLTSAGYVVVSDSEHLTQYVEVEPGLLQNRLEPSDRMVYTTNAAGQRVLLPGTPFALIQTPWYNTSAFNGLLLFVGLVLSMGALLRSPIRVFTGLRRRESQPLGAILGRGAAAGFGVLLLGFLGSFLALFADIVPAYDVPRIFFETTPLAAASKILSAALALAGLLMLVFTALAWKNRYWHLWGRIHYTLLTLSALSLVWLMVHWNLLL